MNFLGIGPLELIVILVVALVFVGPERLPRLAADLARTIRDIRRYTGSLAAEFNEVVKDFEKETEGERSQWKEIGEGLSDATRSVTEAVRAARADAEIPAAPAAAPSQPAVPPTTSEALNGAGNGVPKAPGTWIDIEAPASPAPAPPESPEEVAPASSTPSVAEEPR